MPSRPGRRPSGPGLPGARLTVRYVHVRLRWRTVIALIQLLDAAAAGGTDSARSDARAFPPAARA